MIWQVVLTATVPRRDKAIYRLIVSADAADALMKHPRNATLRIRNTHMETALELCLTVTALVTVVAFGVSLDGHTLPSFGTLALNLGEQWITEMGTDLIIALWFTVYMKQPVMAIENRTFQGWTLIISIFIFYINGACVHEVRAHCSPAHCPLSCAFAPLARATPPNNRLLPDSNRLAPHVRAPGPRRTRVDAASRSRAETNQ